MHGVSFKKRAPRAIKEIRGFASKAMVSFICVFPFLTKFFSPEFPCTTLLVEAFCRHNSKMELKCVFPLSFMLTKDGLVI